MSEIADVVAAKLRITPALEVRVLAQGYQGKRYVHIREFALTNENEFVPTLKGVTLPLGQLDDAIDAVRELRDAEGQEGLVAVLTASGGREIQFSVSKWQGSTKADLRFYFTKTGSAAAVPTKKGVRLSLGLLPELERGLEALKRECHV
jgi:hypothetical protein